MLPYYPPPNTIVIAIAFPVVVPPKLDSAVDAVVAPVPPAVKGKVPVVNALVDVAYIAPPEVNVVKPVPPEAVFKVPDVGVTNKYPVVAGKVTVLVPATNGACNVIDPLVSPAMTIELI